MAIPQVPGEQLPQTPEEGQPTESTHIGATKTLQEQARDIIKNEEAREPVTKTLTPISEIVELL